MMVSLLVVVIKVVETKEVEDVVIVVTQKIQASLLQSQ